jgi:hypothetical protein
VGKWSCLHLVRGVNSLQILTQFEQTKMSARNGVEYQQAEDQADNTQEFSRTTASEDGLSARIPCNEETP